MAFLDPLSSAVRKKALVDAPVTRALMEVSGCTLCPLASIQRPPLPAHGADKPLVYLLGSGVRPSESVAKRHFGGEECRLVFGRIPIIMRDKCRFNNVTRSPGKFGMKESELVLARRACRSSVVEDIERTKPLAVFLFGREALQFVVNSQDTDEVSINAWRGRYFPVRIGNHTCWAFAMLDPYVVMSERRWTPESLDKYGCDKEFTLAFDLRRAFNLFDTLPPPSIITSEQAVAGLEIVTGGNDGDFRRLKKYVNECRSGQVVGFDIETNALRPYNDDARILTLGFSSKDLSFAVALNHSQSRWSASEIAAVRELLSDWLRTDGPLLAVHNAAFEMEWIGRKWSTRHVLSNRWRCSQAQAYILDERSEMQSLNALCVQHFGLPLKRIDNLDRKNLDREPLESVLRYNALDARFHRKLYLRQSLLIEKAGLDKVYAEHMRRIPATVMTQLKGIPVDQKRVEFYHNKFSSQIEKLENEIQQTDEAAAFLRKAGSPLRPSNNYDVQKALRLSGYVVTSVNEVALLALDAKSPFTKLLLEHRKLSKLRSTYVEPLRVGSRVLFDDGRIHPVLTTTFTSTWRTSSADPNSQNFPKRKNKEIRSMISPGTGEVIVSFDYGQIQARNVAMESLDRVLIKSFWERYDIHKDWALRIAKTFPAWVKEDGGGVKALRDPELMDRYRYFAKNRMVFPSFFGASFNSVANYLGLPPDVAERLLNDFWSQFNGVRAWQKRARDNYNRFGYVTGLSGFRRRAPVSPNELINAPIQSDEVVIVCDAMAKLSRKGIVASMEIHDDLTFVWKTRDVTRKAKEVIRTMLSPTYKWARVVPIVSEMSVGRNWADMHKVGDFSSDTWDGQIPDWRQKLEG